MPLVAHESTTRRVEIDGEWYELRTQLGWYAREKASAANAVRFFVKGKDLEEIEDREVEGKLDTATANMRKFIVYLKSWSHSEPLTEENIRRIPAAHARRLVTEITELEKLQDGLNETDPLP